VRRWLAWAAVASVGLVAVLFVAGLPLHTYLQQRSALQAAQSQAQSLAAQKRQLDAEIARLGSNAEVERLARQYYGLVMPGEQAFAILPAPSPQPSAPPRPAPRRRGPSPHPGLLSRLLSEFAF